ncbi:MAG: tRNA (adenosine(37)-N6)-dimethylallyltransferase MiaA [Gemmatimonas sp.]
MPVLSVITGPTAAGKSAVAMMLAARFNLSIVSADSRQVYTGFDIGTAKPTVRDREQIPHYGIDVLDPRNRYSAHAWAGDAARWMDGSTAAGRGSVIVGGTGFYIRALVRPLADAPVLDVERRAKLEQWLLGLSFETLQAWCRALDPARAGLGRTQLLRAIETALLSGTRLGDAHAAPAAETRPVRYLVVDPGPPLADQIRSRVHQMVEDGWPDETLRLMQSVPPDAPAWLSSGYGVMRQHVSGELSRTDAVERIVIETRQYAKRQRTWCRHQLNEGPVTRISPRDPDAMERAAAWWEGAETHA